LDFLNYNESEFDLNVINCIDNNNNENDIDYIIDEKENIEKTKEKKYDEKDSDNFDNYKNRNYMKKISIDNGIYFYY
jgi:hypothetical protein